MFLPEQIPLERDESTALLIENANQDDAEQALADAKKVIDDFIQFDANTGKATSNALQMNQAAWHTPEIIGALATIKRHEEQTYTRIKLALKQWKIATDVDKAVAAQLRTLAPALNPVAAILDSIQASSDREPTLENGALVLPAEDGRVKRRIESEAAVIIAVALKGFARFDQELGVWYVFNGLYWDEQDAKRIISRVLVKMLYMGCHVIGYRNAYLNGIRAILESGYLLEAPRDSVGYLPFENGLLNIETRVLSPITHETALTWCLPYPYTPKADCPRIKAWLKWAVDDDMETVELLRAFMAAILHRRYDLQKFLHLLGPGGTGKSTFVNLVIALVGAVNYVATSFNGIETDKFELARLHQKMLAIIADSERNGGSLQNFKAATGGDPLRYEVKHQQSTGSFIYKGLFIVISNENIQNTDNSSGIARRPITVYFKRRVSEEQKLDWQARGGEAAVLHSELPGLVNWLLELSQDDISRIIRNPPERTLDANFEAMTDTNSVAGWLVECCMPDKDAETKIGNGKKIPEPGSETKYKDFEIELYPSYLQWSSRNGKSAVSSTRFKNLVIDTVQTLGFEAAERRVAAGRFIRGLRLRQDWENPEPVWRKGCRK
ncbi:DNA primase family protein [Methylomonas rapida]|uniref:Phage/plasmid primase, P4 family n=1 Tax=Methylomonas rapida TaxID=2963939 RepID=A0ABY7GHM1_9GAMM|nr:phage/plasmid primase, P4 family [Methylomonas rapida]WAR43724.1 phage/plasmid primase, P4 family [Methylomonas rapida]